MAQFEGSFEISYTAKRAGGGIAIMSDNTGCKGGDGNQLNCTPVQKNSQREIDYLVAYFILSVEQSNNPVQ